jgi:hypothetical protein
MVIVLLDLGSHLEDTDECPTLTARKEQRTHVHLEPALNAALH